MGLPERREKESDNAYNALLDYCQMGAGRSLSSLVNRYQTVSKSLPPTKRITTLKQWSSRYEWQARTAAYDADIKAEAEEKLKAHRLAVLEEGFALDFERVRALKRLAALLESEVYEDEKRWVPDVKSIGAGQYAVQVDIVRFNPAIIDQFRGTLDDIAKEVGGRKTKIEATGANGEPLQFNTVIALSAEQELAEWRKQQQQTIAAQSSTTNAA